MHLLINLVVLCACASVSMSHVLSHTTNDLVNTASSKISDSAIEESDISKSSLGIFIEYTRTTFTVSTGVLSVGRYRRSFIKTSYCPTGQVRLKNICVTCSQYEEIREEDCPLQE